jgi:hypothetical protein
MLTVVAPLKNFLRKMKGEFLLWVSCLKVSLKSYDHFQDKTPSHTDDDRNNRIDSQLLKLIPQD